MHEIGKVSFTYLDCCLFWFILIIFFLSLYILLHIFNAFSTPRCNAIILCKALWIVLHMKCAVQINLTWLDLTICSVPQAAGRFWVRLEEARPCRCRLLGACGQGLLLTSSCTPLALCMSSPALTETITSQLCGKTSCQVRTKESQP